MDVLAHAALPFPQSLPEFQQLFPNDTACAAYLEKVRWAASFACPHCGVSGQPFRFENRVGVLRCRICRKDTSLTGGTVMQGSHMPLSTWFWATYLVASQTPGISALQFQRQLGLSRYETAFGLLHKLRVGMVGLTATGSRARPRTSGKTVVTLDGSGWLSLMTAARPPMAASSRTPLNLGFCSSQTIGAPIAACGRTAMTTIPLLSVAIPKCPWTSCR